MIQALIILLIGGLRSADGLDKIPKFISVILCTGLVIVGLGIVNPLVMVGIAGGFSLGLLPGWGKYLTASGEGTYKTEEEESKVVDFILKYVKSDLEPVLGMSLRWFIYFIPLFAVLLNPFVFGLLAIGPLYYVHRFHKSWLVTEFSTGALLGLLLMLPHYIG